MNGTQTFNTNPLLGDSVLNSKYFNPDYLFQQGVDFLKNVSEFSIHISPTLITFYHGLLFFTSAFFIYIICYTSVRMFEIRRKEHNYLHHEIEEYAHHMVEKEKKAQQNDEVSKNPRWIKTLSYLFSQHVSDWKLAIIEADSMLDELMTELSFKGDSLGDKLKNATQDKFRGLSLAWEVHTIRNRIAHEGMNYEITQREAKRVIAIYESIFREFGFI